MESLRIAIAPVCYEAVTASLANQNQDCVVVETGMTALAVKSPGGEIYEVCRAWTCHVAGPVALGTKILTARSLSAGTSRSTESLRISAPGGMVIDGLPLNVRIRSDPATIAAPEPRSAM